MNCVGTKRENGELHDDTTGPEVVHIPPPTRKQVDAAA